MQIDLTTLTDLGIFSKKEESSIATLLDFTQSHGGSMLLQKKLRSPLNSREKIEQEQTVIQHFMRFNHQVPTMISNGTMMVLDKYYEQPVASIPEKSTVLDVFFYQLFHRADYILLRYSVKHIYDFIRGMQQWVLLLWQEDKTPLPLKILLEKVQSILQQASLQKIIKHVHTSKITAQQNVALGNFFYKYKNQIRTLESIYYQIDVWQSLAKACQEHSFSFPTFIKEDVPCIKAKQLWHPLLQQPIAYDFDLTPNQNFMFLTGANMAGKSTFIRAIGISVYLAHLGIGVPATSLQLSHFNGIVSNIDITDNTLKGESYFYNEVKRVHHIIDKINNKNTWLVLIDELFKGTNISDAMKCSLTVIEGLRKLHNTLFVLSTHLYEIGNTLQQYSNLQFAYFETHIDDNEHLHFSYQLKKGISNDRLGYVILKKEGIVDKLATL